MKKISRRHVIVTLASTATFLCPAVLNAATTADLSGWANIPTDIPMGLKQVLRLGNGPASIDISQLKPGDVSVIARPNDRADYAGTGQTQYVAVMRRDNDYLIVELTCPHKGKASGLTGDPKVPFAAQNVVGTTLVSLTQLGWELQVNHQEIQCLFQSIS